MDIKIAGRNLEITPELRRLLERKLAAVQRHLPTAETALVAVSYEPTRAYRERILVQVSLRVNGSRLRAEQRGPTALAAINAAADSLNLAADRYKGRAYRSSRARHQVSLSRQQAADRDALDRELARPADPQRELERAAA